MRRPDFLTLGLPGLLPLFVLLLLSPAWAQPPDQTAKSTVLTLQKAVALAIERNRGVLQSKNELGSSEFFLASDRAEFDLKFVPFASYRTGEEQATDGSDYEVGLAMKKRLSFGPSFSFGPEIIKRDEEFESGLKVSLRVPLLNGAGREVAMDDVFASEHLLRSSRRTHYQRLVQAALDTATQLYEVKRQDALVRLGNDLVARLDGHARSARAREKVELATSLDVYRAEIQQRNAQEDLIRARDALNTALDRLKELLAFPPDTVLVIEAPLEPERVELGEQEALEIALDNRVELHQAQDEVTEARRNSRVARRNILPQVDLVTSYRQFSTDTSFSGSTDLDNGSWSFGLQASTDLGRRSETLDYRRSLLNVHTRKIERDESRQQIVNETRAQLRKLARARDEIALREQKAHQAQGKLLLAQAEFNHGMATNFDLIEAEIELNQARGGLSQASIDYIVGVFELREVLGTLLDRREFGL